MNTKDFFKELYGNCSEGYLSLLTLPQKETFQFPVGEYEQVVDKAIEIGEQTNTYFNVCPRKSLMAGNLRGGSGDVQYVPCLYADYDVKGSAHAQDKLPEADEIIISQLHNLTIAPNIIVNSGYGIHAYWVFNEPYYIHNNDELKYITEISRGFGKYLGVEAKKQGWLIDSVSDLARALRVPGTYNHKGGEKKLCHVVESTKTRYPVSEFEKYRDITSEKEETPEIDPDYVGNAERVLDSCAFMRYCRDEAVNLPEPLWHAMISNIALVSDGHDVVHTLSEPYQNYTYEETTNKLQRALKQRKPHTCGYIKGCLGFDCPDNGCNVKAPISFAVFSMSERLQNLMANDVSAEEALSDKTLTLMAYAKERQPADYSRFKLRLKKLGIGLRDFEKAVKHVAELKEPLPFEVFQGEVNLDGIDLNGAVTPQGFNVSMEEGIEQITYIKDCPVNTTVAPAPVVITRRMENVDNGLEKVELAFYRNGRWKYLVIPRSEAFNKASIIKFADSGLPVNSSTAESLVEYLSAYEASNTKSISFIRSIDRIGWIGKEFYPFKYDSNIIFESDNGDSVDVIDNLRVEGNYDMWLQTATVVRQNSIARISLAASFASPLLEHLRHRVFMLHAWHDSRGGKTASLKLALSVWGNPLKLLGTFNATAVGLERTCGTMRHLPFGLDELQVLNERRLSVETIVYSLGNGIGKLRGSKSGGLQSAPNWRNIIVSTGEIPLSRENSIDGIASRVIEVYGRPINDEDFAREVHQICERNYGHAGADYIKYIINEVLSGSSKLMYDFNALKLELKSNFDVLGMGDAGQHLDNITATCLGDYYSSISVFGLSQEKAWQEAINLGMATLQNNKALQPEDSIRRAWEFTTQWVAANRNRFRPDATPSYGVIDFNKVYILPQELNAALEAGGYSYTKSTKGFRERGFIETFTDSDGTKRTQTQRKISGVNTRVIVANIEVVAQRQPCDDDFNIAFDTQPLVGKNSA